MLNEKETKEIFNNVISLYNVDKESRRGEVDINDNYFEEILLNDITWWKILSWVEYINNFDKEDVIQLYNNRLELKYLSYNKEWERVYDISWTFSFNKTFWKVWIDWFNIVTNNKHELHSLFDKNLLNFYTDFMNKYILPLDSQIEKRNIDIDNNL